MLLAECLGQEGSNQLTDLIENKRLNDPAAIANLSPQAFTQAAIAGFFIQETLQNEAVLDKLVGDLAVSVAQSENGIAGQPLQVQQAFANAILTGDTSGLEPSLAEQAIVTQADYQGILEAIATQDYSRILDRPTTAGNKLRQFGACGLSMKQVDLTGIGEKNSEAETLRAVNAFLQGASDAQIQAKFGVPAGAVGTIRNGHPFQSKAEFIAVFSRVSGDNRAITGYGAWTAFGPPSNKGDDDPSEDEPTDADGAN